MVGCEVGKVNRMGPVPACRRRGTETEASRKVGGTYLMVLRVKVMVWRRGIVAVRRAWSIGCACFLLSIEAAVLRRWILLRCSTCLVRCLKYKLSRIGGRTVGHWLTAPRQALCSVRRQGAQVQRQVQEGEEGGGPDRVADGSLSKVLEMGGLGLASAGVARASEGEHEGRDDAAPASSECAPRYITWPLHTTGRPQPSACNHYRVCTLRVTVVAHPRATGARLKFAPKSAGHPLMGG